MTTSVPTYITLHRFHTYATYVTYVAKAQIQDNDTNTSMQKKCLCYKNRYHLCQDQYPRLRTSNTFEETPLCGAQQSRLSPLLAKGF